MPGAILKDDCPKMHGTSCQCQPRCAVCSYGPHMAIHGPVYGAERGSKPWGHEYATEREVE